MDKNVLKNITYGLYIISTMNEIKPTGCIANTAMQVTYDTIAISLNHTNFTNKCIKQCKKFAISILDENVRPEIFGIFGYQSGKDIDKFSQVKSLQVTDLSVISEGSCGYIICEVIDFIETETHTVFIGKIKDGEVLETSKPMTYAYYQTVLKGRAPASAPTYISEENKMDEQVKYRCSVCGYIYDGDINLEPEDFTCPICQQPKSVFKLVE